MVTCPGLERRALHLLPAAMHRQQLPYSLRRVGALSQFLVGEPLILFREWPRKGNGLARSHMVTMQSELQLGPGHPDFRTLHASPREAPGENIVRFCGFLSVDSTDRGGAGATALWYSRINRRSLGHGAGRLAVCVTQDSRGKTSVSQSGYTQYSWRVRWFSV